MYLAMIPRLDAEAQLSAVRGAIVSRALNMEPKDADRWMAERDRVATGADAEDAPRAAKATPEALAAMGIGVVMMEAVDG